jgi:hypothetical protein
MKLRTWLFVLLITLAFDLRAAPPAKPPEKPDAVKKLADVPENLKKPIATIAEGFPKYEVTKFPKEPADAAFLFRNDSGTVAVGFKEGKVVYMVFKVGVGQAGLNAAKARSLHEQYSKKLLHEEWVGQNYRAAMVGSINAVVIALKDMDVSVLTHGM